MTQAASTILAKPLFRVAKNFPDIRICYISSRAVSTIQKMPDGKYTVVKLYEGVVAEFAKYSQARREAINSAMKSATDTPNAGQGYMKSFTKGDRIVSVICKGADGKYVVVKLYEEEATECSHYQTAQKEAARAAMSQMPRTTKDAA